MINFPNNPVDQQTVRVGQVNYIWTTASQSWSAIKGFTNTDFLTDNRVISRDATSATSTTTGALVVTGGAGFGGDIWADRIYSNGILLDTGVASLQVVTYQGNTTDTPLITTNATSATSTITGAVIVTGGVGIGQALYVGNTSYISGAEIITTATFNNFGISSITPGADISVSTGTTAAYVTISSTSTLETVTSRGSSSTYAISLSNTTASTSTATGALTVAGGVGVGGNIHVGGNLTVAGQTTASNNITFPNASTGIVGGANYGTVYAGQWTGAQYLTLPSAVLPLNGDFTVESWINFNTIGGGYMNWCFLSGNAGASAALRIEIGPATGYGLQLLMSQTGSGWAVNSTGAILSPSTWYHIAMVRSGNALILYVNGAVYISTTLSGALFSGADNWIGNADGTANYWNGYISNFRVVNSAVYTGTFTPPTATLTAVSGTQLLTLQNSSIIDNSSNNYTITNIGAVTAQSLAVPSITGTGSNIVNFLFDGSRWQSSGAVSISNTATSTSTTTGALQVNGGIGVSGSVVSGAGYAIASSTGTIAARISFNPLQNSIDFTFNS